MGVKLKGFTETARNLRRIADQGSLAALTTTRAQARELLKRARAVAPRLTGRLEDSGKVVEVTQGKNRIAWGVTFDTPYAVIRHEDFYNLGPVSQLKPPTQDGAVGRKFLARPFINMAPQILAKVSDAVKQVSGG